jgi:hypothetical protein
MLFFRSLSFYNMERTARFVALALGACAVLSATVAVLRSTDGEGQFMNLRSVDSKKKIARLLIDEGVSATVECRDQTFAYCHNAACVSLTNDTAACGCKIYRGRKGSFQIDKTTALLIGSKTYRRAVQAVADGRDEKARTLICDALTDGTLYTEAGYDTQYGSLSLVTASDDDGDGAGDDAAAAGDDDAAAAGGGDDAASRRKLGGLAEDTSCMGAPCSFDDSWNKKCDVTCLCPATTVDSNTCVKNGDEDQYWFNLASLTAIVDELADDFSKKGNLVSDITDSKNCRKMCTVSSADEDDDDAAAADDGASADDGSVVAAGDDDAMSSKKKGKSG